MVDVFGTIDESLGIVSSGSMESTDYESETEDCTVHPEALTLVLFGRKELIAKEKDEKQSAKRRTVLDNRFHRTLV